MDRQQKNRSFKWVWIAATVIFCALLIFAIAPGAAAQGSSNPSQLQRQNYANLIQNVYNFIIQNYVEEVDQKALFEGAMNGMFGALNDPYSIYMT